MVYKEYGVRFLKMLFGGDGVNVGLVVRLNST
jgi:acyl dehydratase